MRILAICADLDIKHRLGATPTWWQFLKGLAEIGHNVHVLSLLSEPIESPWWTAGKHPARSIAKLYIKGNSFLKSNPSAARKRFAKGVRKIVDARFKNAWEKYIIQVLRANRDIDVVLYMDGTLLSILGNLPDIIRRGFGKPVVCYEPDIPGILPRFASTRGAASEMRSLDKLNFDRFDAFIIPSKGAVKDLEEMKITNIHTVYFGVDPSIFTPVNTAKEIDVSFYAHGLHQREIWADWLIAMPSKSMPNINFTIAGGGLKEHAGSASILGVLPYPEWREFCCKSKIVLNIARSSFAETYASSIARPFELAALGCCIVSNPVLGMEEWFEQKKELFIANNENEASELYRWLLSDNETRMRVGKNARLRVLSSHTHVHRAKQIEQILQRVL